uniref:GST N-terminal domain-containing protein n=1 Tax=Sus scrofa TaxID=9823 RepID=A0A8D0MTI6_PIG
MGAGPGQQPRKPWASQRLTWAPENPWLGEGSRSPSTWPGAAVGKGTAPLGLGWGAGPRRGRHTSRPAFTTRSEDKFPAQLWRSLSGQGSETNTMTLILGYWDIRGLAHAIRLLLEYTDSSYEEKKYTMGDGNGILFCSGPADSGQPCHVLTPVAR